MSGRARRAGRLLGQALTARVLDALPLRREPPRPLLRAENAPAQERTSRAAEPEAAEWKPPTPEQATAVGSPPAAAAQREHGWEHARQPAAARSERERLSAFLDRFCYVRSDYARQWKRESPDQPGAIEVGWARVGKQQPDRCELTPSVIAAHLRGRITVGTYLLDAHNRCKMLVLDHDDKRVLSEIDPATGKNRVLAEDGLALLQDCRERFREQGIASALVESRRGGHLFVFFDEPVAARDARALAFLGLGPEEAERMHHGQQAFEIYPKQDQRGGRAGAVGSNIALPLGVHLKDGRRYPFIDERGETVARTPSGQLDYVETIARVPAREILRQRPWLYAELDRAMHPVGVRSREVQEPQEPWTPWERREPLPTQPRALRTPAPWRRDARAMGQLPGSAANGTRPSLIARWKAAVDCRDVVRAYGIALSANGVGRCPFHDDQHASFQAWRDGWTCYAEDRSGDALTFVMEQESMSPREALAFVRARFPVPGLELHGPGQPRGRA